MRTQMPIVIRFLGKNMGSIPIDVCHGKIPDSFRTSMFGPTTEFELSDAKAQNGLRYLTSVKIPSYHSYYLSFHFLLKVNTASTTAEWQCCEYHRRV